MLADMVVDPLENVEVQYNGDVDHDTTSITGTYEEYFSEPSIMPNNT